MQYRIYLLDSNRHVQATESFSATSELEAKEVAMALHGSCSTSFQSVELWQGKNLVLHQFSHKVEATAELQKLIDKRQESLAQLEEMLERSFQCIRDSRELMDALHTIRDNKARS